MPFHYTRTIRFPDTDAAGVTFFANYLRICHEAYEESLAAHGIEVSRFFADHGVVIPISKASCDYLRPLVCGDKVDIAVAPTRLSDDTFALDFEVRRGGPEGKLAAVARTTHVCLRSTTRERIRLPDTMEAWLNAR